MIGSILSTAYQNRLVKPVLRFVQRRHWLSATMTPNHITILAITVGLFIPFAILLNLPWLAVFLLLSSGFLDSMDGVLARQAQMQSDFGTVLDIVGDRIVEVAVVLGLFFFDLDARAMISVLMLASMVICITSFLVVAIFVENQSDKNFHYSSGIIERTETFAFFIAMILFPNWFNLLGVLFILLVLLTAAVRVYQFYAFSCKSTSTP